MEKKLFVLTRKEAEKFPWPSDENIRLPEVFAPSRFCKAEIYEQYILGTIFVPGSLTENRKEPLRLSYVFLPGRIIFVDDDGETKKIMSALKEKKNLDTESPGRILGFFLNALMIHDLERLEKMEDQLMKMEDAVLGGAPEDFNHKMIRYRKQILKLSHYYEQLEHMGETLAANENHMFTKKEVEDFRLLAQRASRLKGETQMLHELSLQVREVYQAQIDIRQNKIMMTLTIVTTVCMPLSLIAGWYGMNFSNMPELTWKYGYPFVIGISFVIVLLCVWYCKKKHYF